MMKRVKLPPQESLIRIFVNGEFVSGLLCTSKDVKELAVGWLFDQGFIQSIDDISSLGACEELTDVQVRLGNGQQARTERNHVIRTSACMGGEIPYSQFLRATPRFAAGPLVSLRVLKGLMKEALSMASSYKQTGGIHCAAIASATDEKVLACFEDVGRHNAVDKAIGRMLFTRERTGNKLLLTSGRLSSEMVLKAARSRIPVVASVTTSTDLAIRMAEEAGLTLVGRGLSAQPVIWCGENRILEDRATPEHGF